jgi:hypothetical protein
MSIARVLQVFIVLLAAAVLQVTAQLDLTRAQQAQNWTAQFDMAFCDINGNCDGNHLYYNWDVQAQRIDHGLGSTECVKFYNATAGCSLIMNSKGLWALTGKVADGSYTSCCLDMPGIGAPPTNWGANLTYMGDNFVYSDTNCTGFYYQSETGHTYFEKQDDTRGVPCAFTFPNADAQNMIFTVDTYRAQAQDSSLFELPAFCRDVC